MCAISGLRVYLSNISAASATFLACAVVGAGVDFVGVITSGQNESNLFFGLFEFVVWIALGLFLGGIVWVATTLSSWRRSMTRRVEKVRDSAAEALRESTLAES